MWDTELHLLSELTVPGSPDLLGYADLFMVGESYKKQSLSLRVSTIYIVKWAKMICIYNTAL